MTKDYHRSAWLAASVASTVVSCSASATVVTEGFESLIARPEGSTIGRLVSPIPGGGSLARIFDCVVIIANPPLAGWDSQFGPDFAPPEFGEVFMGMTMPGAAGIIVSEMAMSDLRFYLLDVDSEIVTAQLFDAAGQMLATREVPGTPSGDGAGKLVDFTGVQNVWSISFTILDASGGTVPVGVGFDNFSADVVPAPWTLTLIGVVTCLRSRRR